MDWKNNVQEWHFHDEEQLNQHKDVPEVSSSECEKTILFIHNEVESSLIDDAELTELENWRRNYVYEKVPYRGQKCISVRWVCTEKYIDRKQVIKIRLLARGLEGVDIL